jgi:N-acetylglucosamine-6-phosphate deacetylase
LNPGKAGAHNPEFIRPFSLAEVIELQRASGDAVRCITLAPELVEPEGCQALHALDIRISAGHSMADYEQATSAFRHGVQRGTHLFNAMPPLDHRAPGLAGAVLDAEDVFAELILDYCHVHPAVARMVIRVKGSGRVVLVTDALPLSGLVLGRYVWDNRAVELTAQGIFLVGGPLAGSNLSLLGAVRHAVELGFPLAQAWRMASLTPAQAAGLDCRKGALAPHLDADLLLFSADLSLQKVYCRGRQLP